MNVSQFKTLMLEKNPESTFFHKDNMKFAGDTMRNFGVRKISLTVYCNNEPKFMEVIELYRKKTTSKGFFRSFYFDTETLRSVYPVN